MAAVKIPVGPTRGKTITECTVAELEAACDEVDARLCQAKRGEASKKHKAFVGAARILLRFRKFPVGPYSDTEAANRALRDAAEVGHLLAPSSQLAQVLDGCSIIITAFRVDIKADTFPSDEDPKQLVPAKSMLDLVARDLGVNWIAKDSRRTDNQTNPYLRGFQVAGLLREFDGGWRDLQAHSEIDLSRGSALYNAVLDRYGDKGVFEIDRRRRYIVSHADTAARLRAVRQLGLKDSYLAAELAKPFFCARIVFDGKSENPATKAIFDSAIAQAFVPSAKALFGKRASGER